MDNRSESCSIVLNRFSSRFQGEKEFDCRCYSVIEPIVSEENEVQKVKGTRVLEKSYQGKDKDYIGRERLATSIKTTQEKYI